jgi:hypothetical protein
MLPPFIYFKNIVLHFENYDKINQDIVNDAIYKYAKIYYKILCIVGYTKIIKSGKIYRFEVYILRYRHLLFFYSLKYKTNFFTR